MRESDLKHIKTWRLAKLATNKRKALAYARDLTKRVAYRDWMIEDLERDISQIKLELSKRATTVNRARLAGEVGGK